MKHKRNDVILIVGLLLISIIFLFVRNFNQEDGGNALVTVDGEVYKSFPLSEETTETIELDDGRYNTIVIKDGYVTMLEASCPDQICVNHRPINKSGETIVCLPNKVVIEIENGSQSDIDAIVK